MGGKADTMHGMTIRGCEDKTAVQAGGRGLEERLGEGCRPGLQACCRALACRLPPSLLLLILHHHKQLPEKKDDGVVVARISSTEITQHKFL